jgi:hypothetical protein
MSKIIKIKRPTQDIKAVITLYGKPRHGKTATLRYLYYLLSGCSITQFKKGVGNHKDFRAIINYQDRTILLSTVGDSVPDIDVNWMFFDGNMSFYKPGDKRMRPCINYSSPIGENVIVISPTRINDASARRQNDYISSIKDKLRCALFIHKRSPFRIVGPIDSETWDILTNSSEPKGDWTDSKARSAIRTAEEIKEQIDWIIKHL